MKDDRLYLIHIRECIERVMSYTEGGKDFFFADTNTRMQSCATCKSLPSPRNVFLTH